MDTTVNKIIFSRKGFDSRYGGDASPILPDGTLLSLPIPVSSKEENGTAYGKIQYRDTHLQAIMKELGIWGKLRRYQHSAHFDPDLRKGAVPRDASWQPAFGQCGAAEAHLQKAGVTVGDIFLFFGTFKRTRGEIGRNLQFEKDYPRHIIFGYLRIEDIYRHDQLEQVPVALQTHPHFVNRHQDKYGTNNTLYVGTGGTFKYNDKLVLTRSGFSKSRWQLPGFFHPEFGTVISRHEKAERFRWLKDKDSIHLDTIGIGQDFVVSGWGERVVNWAEELIMSCKNS